MISVSHPTGNTFVRALLKELHASDDLDRFYTTLGCGYDSLLRIPLKRRTYPIPSRKIVTHSWPELERLISSRMSPDRNRRQTSVDLVYQNLDRWVANQLPKRLMPIQINQPPRGGVGFGYGFSVRTKMTGWDSGGKVGEYGWGGAASTHYWVHPGDELVVIIVERYALEFWLCVGVYP